MNTITVTDLRATEASQLQGIVHETVRVLERDGVVRLRFAEDPELLLRSVNLRLRNNLSWQVRQELGAGWVAEVHRAEDVPPHDVLDALQRDHKRIDALFSRVIHLTDRNELVAAADYMEQFVVAIRRHLVVEHDMLARAIRTRADATGVDPSAAMIDEHREILAQSAMILAAFEETDASAASVSPLLAILAGYLSKHEVREEMTLFPIWQRALSHAPQPDRSALFERVLTQLEL
ncbi:MAG: hemerythrin domain-containing protein [Betaproteobacteria bacterium]|nr:hemerythrin domain-containing protein [Betaproteobacteria bacterium]